ncbi:DUF7507 domain-containing protein [Leucobacter sp. W1038]|uniref:DUF7507 domain-containing protein n=1 Tax=Leucobacter sp. W1038 TaxID=3438281 RepID=UPI003D995C6E
MDYTPQHARVSRIRRDRRKVAAALLSFLLVAGATLLGTTSAQAASVGSIAITTSSPAIQEVSSVFNFEVTWSCSGLTDEDCFNPRIDIPISLNNLPGGIEDMDSWGVTITPPSPSTANFTSTVVRTPTGLTVQLTSTRTVPAGAQEMLLVSVRPHPSTGDGVGFTFGPATFSSPSFPSVISNSLSGSVTARDLLPIQKVFLGGSAASGATTARATYQITPNIAGVWNPATNQWASCSSQDNNRNVTDTAVAGTVQIVDQLPPEVTFVSATGGGVYDPGTHSVTWSDCSNYLEQPYFVVVEMPAAANAADPAYLNPITNTVTRSFMDTAGVPQSSTSTVNHNNIFQARPDPLFAKCGEGRVIPNASQPSPAGQCRWRFSPTFAYSGALGVHYYRMSATRLLQGDEVTITDWVPCQSNPNPAGFGSDTGCLDPLERITDLRFTSTAGSSSARTIGYQELTLFLSDGTQQVFDATTPIASLSPLPAAPAGTTYVGFSVRLNALTLDGAVQVEMDTRVEPGADRDMDLRNTVSMSVANPTSSYFYEDDATGIGAVRAGISGTSYASINASGSGIRYANGSFGAYALDPNIAYPTYTQVLPAGYKVAGDSLNSIIVNDAEGRSNRSHYDIEFVPEDPATGTPALVRFTPLPGTPAVPADPSQGWPYVSVRITLERTWGNQYGALYTESYSSVTGDTGGQMANCLQYSPFVVGDPRDLDGDGLTTGDTGCLSLGGATFSSPLAPATSVVTKHVRDVNSAAWSGANQVAGITSGAAEYLVHWENSGQPALSDVVLYDLLPHVGDTGATEANTGSRGSAFTPVFDGLSRAIPAGANVAYSASSNPCRPEVFPSQPSCDNDWTADPATLGGNANVKALRITLPGNWASGSSVNIGFRMLVPSGTTSGDVAWNTVAQRALNGGVPLVSAETARTGIMSPAEVRVEKSSPQAGSELGVGEIVSYEITAENRLETLANGVRVVDDLSEVLQHAIYNDDATATSGAVAWDPIAEQLIWTGNLGVGDEATIRFTVTTTSPTPSTGLTNRVIGNIGTLPTNCVTGLEPECTVQAWVVAPEVGLVKSAVGVAEGSTINGFTDVTWNYLVTNTGNEPLEALLVTDDQGVAVTCPATTLAVGASITCTGTGNIGNGASYENIGGVEGVGAITGDPTATADPWSVNIDPVEPTVQIVKSANGIAEGAAVLALTDVTWTYAVTNTGEEPLTGLVVTDDQGVAVSCPAADLAVGASMDCTGTGSVGIQASYANTGMVIGIGTLSGGAVTDDDDWSAIVTPLSRTLSLVKSSPDVTEGGMIDGYSVISWDYLVTNTGQEPVVDLTVVDDQGVTVDCPITSLASGASVTCTGSGSVGAGPEYRNVATAQAVGAITAGQVSAVDDWSVGVRPLTVNVTIDKRSTNATEGTQVRPNTLVDWTYLVTNTGEETLLDLDVTDDQGVAVTCPHTQLLPGESMTCLGSGSVGGEGEYVNVGAVIGESELSSTPVNAEDPWTITVRELVPAISIVKGALNAVDGGSVRADTVVDWQYAVTNTGEEVLTDIVVTDDQGVTVTCPVTDLLPGASMVCEGSGSIGRGASYTNIGAVVGTGVLTGGDVTAEDEWTVSVTMPTPLVSLVKDADGIAVGATLPENTVVSWTYTVMNTGEETLQQIEVTDDQGVQVTCPATVLEPGESMECTGSGSIGDGATYENIGLVLAVGAVSGGEVEDESTWTVVVSDPPVPSTPSLTPPATPPATPPVSVLEHTGGPGQIGLLMVALALIGCGLIATGASRLRKHEE